MQSQQQFLDVIDRDLAKQRFEAALSLQPLAEEVVNLDQALGRVLCRDVVSRVNVPSFDRSNLDGYAVRASDTVGADEQQPKILQLLDEQIAAGYHPQTELQPGCAMIIATGGMIPRGADAIVMLENADLIENQVLVSKPVAPGFGIAFAGTDVASGQIILFKGDLLSSRETGILAAIGESNVTCWKQPRVAIVSTGDEILSPDQDMQPGKVFDSNARIIADAVKELGGIPVELGIANDNREQLKSKIEQALQQADMVLLSGGTSKGQGDLSYQVVNEFDDPGILVHGVALKPGKPICLAATQGKPLVILPGFPTSAIFTFHEFVAPVIRHLAGFPPASVSTVSAELAVRINSEVGRTEFVLVRLLDNAADDSPDQAKQLTAYPIGKGSGSVTTFSHADGFIRVERHTEMVESGSNVTVQLISRDSKAADLVIIGSHCAGLDLIMSQLKHQGIHTRFLSVGSTAGLNAVKRGQCDIAGIHLFDPNSNSYNHPFISDQLQLIQGYRRKQGIVFRKNDPRFTGSDAATVINHIKQLPDCRMINRNQGSGTRILIDQLLEGSQPPGYLVQTSNHRAVIAAIDQGRADWGVAIEAVVTTQLDFLPIQDENYDYVVSETSLQKPAVQQFFEILRDEKMQSNLKNIGINI